MANDAGTAFVDIRARFDRTFGRDIERGIDPHVDNSAKHVETKLGGAFMSVAKVAGGAFAAVGAGRLIKDIIGGASDLNETISKSNTIFGANAKEIEKWAGTAAKSMGQSKQGALDAAATFGNLFVQLGTGSNEAAKMSKEMVGLASDFASFHNADPTDVIEAMTAAFRGEYDAVQRYVPTINAAAVEHKALAMGLATTTKELTAQDKALATQALLMEGAGAAVGDFERTSDGLANKQRILSAQFTDMKDRIGTALLPVVLKAMEAFMGLGETLSGPVSKAVEWFKENWPQIKVTIDETLKTAQTIITGFVDTVRIIWANFGEQIIERAKNAWDTIQGIVRGGLESIQGVMKVITGIMHGDWSTVWEGIKGIVRGAWETMKNLNQIGIDSAKAILSIGMEIISSAWRSAWDGIKNFLGDTWDGMKRKVSEVWGGISGFISDVWEDIKGAFRRGKESIVGFFLDAVGIILEGAARMFGWVPGVGGKLRDAADDFARFRDSVNSSLGGIDDKTIQLFLKANNRNLGTAGDPIYANTGMLVPGVGNSDTVPAWLTPGEFVVRKEAVKAVGVPALERLNAQGYAQGGLVDFKWHLPGVAGIRDAAQGMFDEMADAATEAFRQEQQALADKRAASGGIGTSGHHVGNSWQGITAGLDARGMDYTVTSAYRPGDPGFHGRGKAVDLVGDMASIFHMIASFQGVNELFYDPIGWYLDEGSRHSGAIGDHDDHVHAATFHGGGVVPGRIGQDRLAVVEAGERISPVGDTIDYERLINGIGDRVAKALREEPPVMRVSTLAKGLHDSRRR